MSTPVNPNKCIGRRITPGRKDRSFTPHLYIPKQCRNDPTDGNTLCSTCSYRKQIWSYGGPEMWKWHGVVTEPDIVPANSHIHGSAWFHDKCKKAPTSTPSNPALIAERLAAIEKRLVAIELKIAA